MPKLEDEYSIEDSLGSGSYAEVFRCKHRVSGEHFAVKVISKVKAGDKGVKSTLHEVELLKGLDHPSIIHFHAYFETSAFQYIVLEIVSGGELFEKIVELKHYSEMSAALLTRNLCTTLAYLHSKGVCHRDLKPENLMLKSRVVTTSDQQFLQELLTNIKLVDFGFAIRFEKGKRTLTDCCGTPTYIAPEILQYGMFRTAQEGYNESCDMWSTGVLTYVLLCGYPPFHAKQRIDLFKRICEGKFLFHKQTQWDVISSEAKDFIQKLLVTDPNQRLTAEGALQHPWLAQQQKDEHLTQAITELMVFNARTKLRGATFGLEAVHRLMYITRCKELQIKPNSAMVKQLDQTTDLEVLDLTNNYVGPKGLQAALQAITGSNVTTLRLADNQIDNDGLQIVLDVVKTHPSITSLDLSNNPLSQLAGRQLLTLLQEDHNIIELKLENTFIKDMMLKKIEAQVERNRAIASRNGGCCVM
eukprot:TRINITY_DN14747_c0_g1_i1.p1 TRINITY_DN14747_c0_g1~~TRINITY_DN14747_c0_g1_i1.p1  ORF type:complete len:472 (-),score=106.16 TRINITY_DN14747_c0_g1_i1:242-1657(-)